MMFCWRQFIPLGTFLKALLLVLLAASATTLDYSDSMKHEDVVNESALDSEKSIENPDSLHSLSKPESSNMSPLLNEQLYFQSNYFKNKQSDRIYLNGESDAAKKSTRTEILLENHKNDDVIIKKVENCGEFCPDHGQRNKNLPFSGLDIISGSERKSNLKSSLLETDVSTADAHQETSKLIQRDVSDAYESADNYDNHKDIIPVTSSNNNNQTADYLEDVYGKNLGNSEFVKNQEPKQSSGELSTSTPVVSEKVADHISSKVSNNRTVGLYSPEISKTSSSTYDADYMNIESKQNFNHDSNSSTSSGEKSTKSSTTFKNLSKLYKNKTLPEVKTLAKNVSTPPVKYSEESKKKALIKSLNDDSLENISLQQATLINNDDLVPLMSDEPADSPGQGKSRSAVFVPEEDSMEFSLHDNGTVVPGIVNGTVLETNETFSTTADGHTMKSSSDGISGFNIAIISGIAVGILIISSIIGAFLFVMYRHRYWNKPQTLSDKCSNADSSGYIDDSTLRDNSEEMYSLDNDSFLNSLEAMTIQNYWTDNVKHTKL